MIDKLIENLPKILRALTFQRVLSACVLAGMLCILAIVWDQRVALVSNLKVSSIASAKNVSIVGNEKTAKAAKELVNRAALITGIQLINVDFRTNTRSTAFFYSDQVALQNIVDNAMALRVSPTPLLIKSDEQNNVRLIMIMTGQFVCYPSETSLLGKAAGEVVALAPYMCSISIPPYEGNFSGYLNLFLKSAPTGDEIEELRTAARILAADIYDRELSK